MEYWSVVRQSVHPQSSPLNVHCIGGNVNRTQAKMQTNATCRLPVTGRLMPLPPEGGVPCSGRNAPKAFGAAAPASRTDRLLQPQQDQQADGGGEQRDRNAELGIIPKTHFHVRPR